MHISTRFSLFVLFLPALAFAANWVKIKNDSDEDILVNVHYGHSNKHIIKAHDDWPFTYGIFDGFVGSWKKLRYISMHILTGPFKGLGGRWDITKETNVIQWKPDEEDREFQPVWGYKLVQPLLKKDPAYQEVIAVEFNNRTLDTLLLSIDIRNGLPEVKEVKFWDHINLSDVFKTFEGYGEDKIPIHILVKKDFDDWQMSHTPEEIEKAKEIMQRKAGMVQMRKSYSSHE